MGHSMASAVGFECDAADTVSRRCRYGRFSNCRRRARARCQGVATVAGEQSGQNAVTDNWDQSGVVGEDLPLRDCPKLRVMAAAVADLQRAVQQQEGQIKELWARVITTSELLEDQRQH